MDLFRERRRGRSFYFDVSKEVREGVRGEGRGGVVEGDNFFFYYRFCGEDVSLFSLSFLFFRFLGLVFYLSFWVVLGFLF